MGSGKSSLVLCGCLCPPGSTLIQCFPASPWMFPRQGFTTNQGRLRQHLITLITELFFPMINQISSFLHFYTLSFAPLWKKERAHSIQTPIAVKNEEDLGSSCVLEGRGVPNPRPPAQDRPRLISNNSAPWIQVERGSQLCGGRF